MIDLHTHTTFSDGELIPSELARRASVKGYRVIGISDHADASNMEQVITSLLRLREEMEYYENITIVPGVEITHVPPRLIPRLIERARRMGVLYVVIHGETIVEPVQEGTNRAAIEGGCDILAHPGLISPQEAALASERDVLLEITSRKGHSLTNGHVARLAREAGAKLVYNTDAHAPTDLTPEVEARRIVLGAGLAPDGFSVMQQNALDLVKRVAGGV